MSSAEKQVERIVLAASGEQGQPRHVWGTQNGAGVRVLEHPLSHGSQPGLIIPSGHLAMSGDGLIVMVGGAAGISWVGPEVLLLQCTGQPSQPDTLGPKHQQA